MSSITDPVHTVRSRPQDGLWFPKHAANSKECCTQQFADSQLRNLCSFCCYPQDVNLSINLQRAASFGWHLISNKDQTAISPPEISASQHDCSTWARGVSKPSITLVKQLTAPQWHHVFIAHKQVIRGWIGTMVCVVKNGRAAQCRLCFRASSIQTRSPPRSWSMQVTESFTKMNSDFPREMLRENNKLYCGGGGGHSNFISDGTWGICWGRISGWRYKPICERPRSVTLNKTLRENRWLQRNKALQSSRSMLNDDLLPPCVPKERQCYVNIYLFIALLSDFPTPFQCRN